MGEGGREGRVSEGREGGTGMSYEHTSLPLCVLEWVPLPFPPPPNLCGPPEGAPLQSGCTWLVAVAPPHFHPAPSPPPQAAKGGREGERMEE